MGAFLEIKLLGPIQVRIDGQPLPKLRSRKALWLLALLALREGRPATRENLASVLWPDTLASNALANLRVVVSDLRRALGPEHGSLLITDRITASLNAAAFSADVLNFDRAIVENDWELAARLYLGDFLEDCTEEWTVQERSSRHEKALVALMTLGERAEKSADHSKAVDLFHRALTLDTVREEPLRGLMRALDAKGDINAALNAYREFAHRLRQNTGSGPDPQTTELYSLLRGKLRQPLKPAELSSRSGKDPVAGNLPIPLTPIVGREDETAEIESRLRNNRLVSLTGVGGIGKTRLVLEVGANLRADFYDGVWFVGLESFTANEAVIQAVASTFGLRVEDAASPIETVIRALRTKRCLVVLDNCEHLLSACSEVCSSLLSSCGDLHLLVTSREALGILGENVYRVPGLSVPNPQHLPQNGATRTRVAISHEGVLLFEVRAQNVAPQFKVSAENAATVAEICARLEGIPLAIELAAVQTSAMSLHSIATHLSDLLLPSARGQKTAQPRQQTVRTALDWSYNLLNAVERRVLESLSMFAGGWTLQAAEAIAGDEPGAQVVTTLRALVEKSLVVFDEGLDRYRLLEPVRQYAAEKLLASGEKTQVQLRFREFFLLLAEEAERSLDGAKQSLWAPRIAAESENLGVAMEDAEVGLKIAAAISGFWYIWGHFEKGATQLQVLLAQCPEPTAARRKALQCAGVHLKSQNKFDSARPLFDEALSIAGLLKDRLATARALGSLASLEHQDNNHEQELLYQEQSLKIFRELNHQRGIINTISSTAFCLICQGRYTPAKLIYEEALTIAEETGNLNVICFINLQLGTIEMDMGNYEAAMRHYKISGEIQEKMLSKRDLGLSLQGKANVKRSLGDFKAAQNLYPQALELFREVDDKLLEAGILTALAELECHECHFTDANDLIQTSLSMHREFSNLLGLAIALRVQAALARLTGDLTLATSAIRECFLLILQVGHPQSAVDAFEELGAIELARAEPGKALQLWDMAANMRLQMETPIPVFRQNQFRIWRDEAERLLGENHSSKNGPDDFGLDWREAARQFSSELSDEKSDQH